MAFTWRTGATDDYASMIVPRTALALRIGVSAVLLLALIYLLLIIDTFKRYGDAMDTRWKEKVARWTSEGQSGTLKASDEAEDSSIGTWAGPRTWIHGSALPPDSQPTEPYSSLAPVREESLPDRPQDEPPSDPLTISPFLSYNNPSETTLTSESFSPFSAVRLMNLSHRSTLLCPLPAVLADRGIVKQHLWQLTTVSYSNSMVEII
jgi:hypothetical protein